MTDDLVKRIDSLMVLLDMERKKSLSLGKHIEKLETANLKAACIKVDDQMHIEKLEAALNDVAGYLARADWYYLKPETRKALEGKDD